ncbi:MAG: MOSC domain-containing protein [Candidatus Velamenicoccus archaeovorus]
MPHVARLNVTPVKSTRLHHPERIVLGPEGAEGNRTFFFVDQDGRRFSGDRKAPLMALWADHDLDEGSIRFRLPDGTEAEGHAAACGPALTVDFYGRPVPSHIVPGPWEAAISAYAERPVRLARPDRPGDAIDVRPVTLVSLASVDELSRQGGRSERVDPGRFRMLIEVDGVAPHEEDTWRGRRLRIGGAVVAAGDPVPRCVITTLDPSTGVRDFPTLSVIERYRGVSADRELLFGIYGDVLEPGEVAVGDPVELLDR